ncbi:MAG: MerR family transcriptional regulator [Chloroflexi bacterium]|nr:MAG: MerR family transcriptional regulator [Chloroflexota bacterium]
MNKSPLPPEGEAPLYNIGVVSRMTGIPENNLRIWERRYGFPRSARTPGGHRLYSEEEVQRLKWVKQRVDGGMQISQAIKALEHMENEGRLPIAPIQRAAYSSFQTTPQSINISSEGLLESYLEALLSALYEHNIEAANMIIGEVLAVNTLEHIIIGLISPAFREIGEAWLRGDISVATEHFATNYLRQRLLLWQQNAPMAYPVAPILLCAAPDEWHEGGLLILNLLLRQLRWPTVYLGQAVPLDEMARFVADTSPAIVVITAMTEPTANELVGWPQHLGSAAQSGNPIVAFGGWIYTQKPELVNQTPGVYLGDTYHEAIQKLDTWMREINPML